MFVISLSFIVLKVFRACYLNKSFCIFWIAFHFMICFVVHILIMHIEADMISVKAKYL